MKSNRAGRSIKQPTGYRAFVPEPLPPNPPLEMNAELIGMLSAADQALGRLDGFAELLPNPDFFVAMYVRREAVLSSQIEGTQSTLGDVLAFELDPDAHQVPQDVEEIVNYIGAMNYGLDRLATLPLSLRLLREIHGELLQGVRGQDREPGEFRTSQNWIGPEHSAIANATFVPPPPHVLMESLGALEEFLHEEHQLPILIHCGLAHAQFETIHPFLDGNGRVGRLLISFLLVHRRALHRPLLYLSTFFKRHRAEYYDRLMAIRLAGDWEGWFRFFLRGVAETATEATGTARQIVQMREEHRLLVEPSGLKALRLVDLLFERPLVNVNFVSEQLEVSYQTANTLVGEFERLALLEEITGNTRNRQFRYEPYVALFNDDDLPFADESELEESISDS